ncbi:DUF707 domain-containing protein [Nocardia sp. NPDC003963]
MATSPRLSENSQVEILSWRPGGRRFLVCIRAGRRSAYLSWFEENEPRDWDLMVHYYELPPEGPDERPEFVVEGGISKFPGIKALWSKRPELIEAYDAVLFLDGDIECTHSGLAEAFSVFESYGLDIAQPALSHESHASWDITLYRHLHQVRYTNFVEIMMPMFSRHGLSRCLDSFDESISGYGLDSVWPSLLDSPERAIGIIDSAVFGHPNPVDLDNGAFYQYLRSLGVEPFQEGHEVTKRYALPEVRATELGVELDRRAVRKSNADIMALTAVADRPDRARDDVIAQIGPERVAEIIVDELVYRANVGRSKLDCIVEFRFVLDGTEFVRMVFPRSSRVLHARVAPGLVPQAVVTQDLYEAVQAVFGPRPKISTATQVLRWCEHDDIDAARTGRLDALFPQVELLLAGLEPSGDQISLTRLALLYGSDKWGIHRYTPQYERYFEPLRDRPLTILEIGIGNGASLRMWKRYFRRAIVFGLDIHDSSRYVEQRITPLLGDQSSSESLERAVEQTGPLDIVIDDGSHISAHVIASFHALFPKLRPGGLYVIEDLQASYWPHWGGNAEEFDDPATSVGFLKLLVDGLNHEELPDASGRVPLYSDGQIRGLHFHHNMVVIEKGSNSQGGAPAWIRKT